MQVKKQMAEEAADKTHACPESHTNIITSHNLLHNTALAYRQPLIEQVLYNNTADTSPTCRSDKPVRHEAPYLGTGVRSAKG